MTFDTANTGKYIFDGRQNLTADEYLALEKEYYARLKSNPSSAYKNMSLTNIADTANQVATYIIIGLAVILPLLSWLLFFKDLPGYFKLFATIGVTGFGVALSESGFCPYLNAKDVMHILKKMYPTFDEDFFRSSCVSQGLALDKKIKDYSTGMRAKLRVLAAISHRAELLIMDEPTAGLDVEARNEILDMLRRYLSDNENCSILLTSHISSDIESGLPG